MNIATTSAVLMDALTKINANEGEVRDMRLKRMQLVNYAVSFISHFSFLRAFCNSLAD